MISLICGIQQNKTTNKAKQSNTSWIHRKSGGCHGGLGGVGEMGDADEEIQTFSCEMNRSWGCGMPHVTVGSSIVRAYLKLLGE